MRNEVINKESLQDLLWALSALNLPLITAFMVSHSLDTLCFHSWFLSWWTVHSVAFMSLYTVHWYSCYLVLIPGGGIESRVLFQFSYNHGDLFIPHL